MTLTDAVIGAEALVGHPLSEQEMRLVKTVLAKGLPDDVTWTQIWVALGASAAKVVASLISLKLHASDYDVDLVKEALREDAETRMKRAGL